jgi:hypothetical protein
MKAEFVDVVGHTSNSSLLSVATSTSAFNVLDY